MNKQTWALLVTTLALIAGTAGFLVRLHSHQRLGVPGVKTSPIANSPRLKVELPPKVLDYSSEELEEDKLVLNVLPKDTSFGRRLYKAPDGFALLTDVVLMGSDRTSLHQPQICLRGKGWNIARTDKAMVPIARPVAFDLPVTKLTLTPEKLEATGDRRGLYVYWFVADNEYTSDHGQRMWWMFRDLLSTGVLQRWAYVICFAVCAPGQEEATFERMKQFIADAVPQFQTPPRLAAQTTVGKDIDLHAGNR